eukprot:scaffold17007_cov91-Phaeocystis_antarctica.AAC.2
MRQLGRRVPGRAGRAARLLVLRHFGAGDTFSANGSGLGRRRVGGRWCARIGHRDQAVAARSPHHGCRWSERSLGRHTQLHRKRVCIKDDHRLISPIAISSDSINPLSLLVHCTPPEPSFIVGKHRHLRQLIHRTVLSELVQCGGLVVEAASYESVVGARQAHGPIEKRCGEAAGPAGRQRLQVGIAACSDEFQAACVVSIARGDRQHATGQHAEAIRSLGHTSQLSHTPRVDVAAPPQLPAVGTRPGGAHACGCVLGKTE